MDEVSVDEMQYYRVALGNKQAKRREDVISRRDFDNKVKLKLRLCEIWEWESFSKGMVIVIATASQLFWEPSRRGNPYAYSYVHPVYGILNLDTHRSA